MALSASSGAKEAELEVQKVRARLTISEMFSPEGFPPGPISNKYFLPMTDHGPPLHDITALVEFPEAEKSNFSFGSFPEVSVRFLSVGNHLVPATRGIIRPQHGRSHWNVIFSPGQIWSEPDDNGMTRAALPFTLTHRKWNKAHNGVATFLFDDSEVSPLVIQIAQETSPGRKFDAWGRIPIELTRGPLTEREKVIDEFAKETNSRLPVLPLQTLAREFGEDGTRFLSQWPDGHHESVSGVMYGGKIYAGQCKTRSGPYPYCEYMRHGVMSVSKSLGALVAMSFLAEKYGASVFELRIADYLNVSSEHDGWDTVTFGDALNMATGIGDEPINTAMVFEDNNFGLYGNFMSRKSAAEKLSVAFSGGNYPWLPGERFRYRSIDTFVLAAAMDSFLKSREGRGANIWDAVMDEVFRHIGVYHAPMMHTVEPDGSRGIPILGEGFFPTIQDIAKISLLLQNEGRHNGHQLLSAVKLRESLYRLEARGLPFPTGTRFAGSSYHMALWHVPFEGKSCTVVVPKMAGWGGNSVLFLPNGMIPFFVQDGFHQIDDAMVAATNEIVPICHSD